MTTLSRKNLKIAGQTLESGVQQFLGIPFAKAPIAEQRFQPPQTLALSSVDAQHYQSPPAQLGEGLEKYNAELTSEDCLYLNIWAPANAKKCPVVIWFHGGGFQSGSGNHPKNHGEIWAERGNCIFVSINYRLNLFGFLETNILEGAPQHSTANLGILDQKIAVEWVAKHIELFGGDPNAITAMGQSAGATCVSTLIAAFPTLPISKVILQSGSPFLFKSKASAQQQAKNFFDNVGIHSYQDLLNTSTQQLLEKLRAFKKTVLETDADQLFMPSIDDEHIHQYPMLSFKEKKAKQVPTLMGFTHDEFRYWARYNADYYLNIDPKKDKNLNRILPKWMIYSLTFYYRGYFPDPAAQALAIISDISFKQPAIRLAKWLNKANTLCYFYQFDHPCNTPQLGACHASDLPFTTGNLEQFRELIGQPENTQASENEQAVLNYTLNNWFHFVHHGHPEDPLWKPYERHARHIQKISSEVTFTVNEHARLRLIWGVAPFVAMN